MAWENQMHLASPENSRMSRCRPQNRNYLDVRNRISLYRHSDDPRHECAQRLDVERRKIAYRRGKARLSRAVSGTSPFPPTHFPLIFIFFFSHRIMLENGTDNTRQRKRKCTRLARGVHGRPAQDMSLVTPETVH